MKHKIIVPDSLKIRTKEWLEVHNKLWPDDEITQVIPVLPKPTLNKEDIEYWVAKSGSREYRVCECGSNKLGSPKHSDWCPVYKIESEG